MFNKINRLNSGVLSEYQDNARHNVINEDMQKSRESILENEQEQTIHIDVGYKNKNVKIHLGFSEEADDKNAKLFCDSLKKVYMEKTKIIL